MIQHQKQKKQIKILKHKHQKRILKHNQLQKAHKRQQPIKVLLQTKVHHQSMNMYGKTINQKDGFLKW